MRPQSQSKGSKYQYYRCRSKELGYDCEQKSVRVNTIDDQVVNILMQLKPPEEWRKGITKGMSEILGEKNLEERLAGNPSHNQTNGSTLGQWLHHE